MSNVLCPDDDIYHALGLAVINAQYFEISFVFCVKQVFAQKDAKDLTELKPFDKNVFRSATKALLNELRQHIEVDPTFERELERLVELRHHFIHRLVLTDAWPNSTGDDRREELKQQLLLFSVEINALTRILVKAIYDWNRRFPEFAEQLKDLPTGWTDRLPEPFRDLQIESRTPPKEPMA